MAARAFDSDAPELAGFPAGAQPGVRATGRRCHQVGHRHSRADAGGLGVGVSEISPDGSQIAVVQTDGGETNEVWVAHSTSGFYDTSAFDLISFGVSDAGLEWSHSPSMSSNGRFVAFASGSNVELSGGAVANFDTEVWLRERPVALDITATLNFGTIDVGTQSAPQNAVVTNTSGVVINISSVTPPASPFIITGNSCGGVLQPVQAARSRRVPTDCCRRASSSITVSGDGLSVTGSLVGVGDRCRPPVR